MLVGVEFAAPLWLLALPALAAILVLARLPWLKAARYSGRRALRQEGRRLALRLAWATLLVLALAGTTLARPLDRQAVMLVLDASASVASARDQAEAAARAIADRLPQGDALGVVAVAAGARVEEPLSTEPVFSRLTAALPDKASDLASGLRLAGALLPEDFAGRVVLVSDGRQTRGDAIAAARALAGRGIAVDVLPLGPLAGPDVRLESVHLPETAYRGEIATITATVHADRPSPATLRVYRDDALILEREVELREGRQDIALAVPVGEPGLHRYRIDVATARPEADGVAVNNTLGAIQRVAGPPRVLIVAAEPAGAGLLTAALQAGGAEVVVGPPASVPADLAAWARYDAAILADVPAEALPAGSMDLLEAYVRDLGRGLAMTGGPDSFGPGGYADTPVERALPVYMDLRGRGKQPRVAMILVIDKSGSMSGTKMEMAKEAGARSIRLLRPDDSAGVLAFDSVPQWVAPVTPLAQRTQLEQAIGRVYAGGGTEIYPALGAAFAALRGVEADIKHLILLTDGRSGSGGAYVDLLREMRDARVSLSTVAVGEDADTGLLEAMARAGRGRYHFAAEPASIPQIFTRETIMATRAVLVEARFHPAAASSGPLLRGLAAVPPLDGYVATTAKEQAEVVLVSPEGDPVLAAWQYGLGRAVAWTPDVAGRWTGAWAGSAATTTLWGNILSWLLPAEGTGELAVQVAAEGDEAIAITAENRSDWEQVRPTTATLIGPGGQAREVALAPAGPGRYRARLAAPEPGAYVVRASQEIGGGGQLHGEVGWVAPYPAEYRAAGADRAFLASLAAAGGGRVLAEAAEAAVPSPRSAVARWPAWPLLIGLAALCWPLEIASRRLAMPAVRWQPAFGRRPVPGGAGTLPLAKPAAASKASTPAPAAGTTQRLLERKRAFRQEQRERQG